eukprot:Phypoly_transcript_16948.p1 GENE.Phypoly_transcript_16948~~Phypoly_transcript_16948.p1  ORF type:complete len:227 (+),score=21.87 Phypoly_transcript_16948:141-821(+)
MDQNDVIGWIKENLHYWTTRKQSDLGHKVLLQCSHFRFFLLNTNEISGENDVRVSICGRNSPTKEWQSLGTTKVRDGESEIFCNSTHFYQYFRVLCSHNIPTHAKLYGKLRVAAKPYPPTNITAVVNYDDANNPPQFDLDFDNVCTQNAILKIMKKGSISAIELFHMCRQIFRIEFCEETLRTMEKFKILQQVGDGYCFGPAITEDLLRLLANEEISISDLGNFIS